MNKLLSKLTETTNPIVNTLVAFALTLIFVCVIALLSNLIVNPDLFNQASF